MEIYNELYGAPIFDVYDDEESPFDIYIDKEPLFDVYDDSDVAVPSFDYFEKNIQVIDSMITSDIRSFDGVMNDSSFASSRRNNESLREFIDKVHVEAFITWHMIQGGTCKKYWHVNYAPAYLVHHESLVLIPKKLHRPPPLRDKVPYVDLQPYRQHSVFRRTSQKLSNRYYGPFEIAERIRPVAYRLMLPEGSRIHPVFHVSTLKLRLGTYTPTSGSLPPLRTNGELPLQPKRALTHRQSSHCQESQDKVCESLIQWRSLPRKEDTWEATTRSKLSFSALNLEDKVAVDEGSNDECQDEEEPDGLGHLSKRRLSTRARKPTRRFLD